MLLEHIATLVNTRTDNYSVEQFYGIRPACMHGHCAMHSVAYHIAALMGIFPRKRFGRCTMAPEYMNTWPTSLGFSSNLAVEPNFISKLPKMAGFFDVLAATKTGVFRSSADQGTTDHVCRRCGSRYRTEIEAQLCCKS